MRRYASLAQLTAVALLLLLSLSACAGTPPPVAHQTTRSAATLTVYTDGVSTGLDSTTMATAHSGAILGAGSRLKTNSSGLASAAFRDESMLRLGPNTSLKIGSQSGNRTNITLSSGQTWHRGKVGKAAAAYRVTSPLAIFDGSGATFALECRSIKCTLIVFEGTVEATPLDAEPIAVNAYQRLVLREATTAEAPSVFPVDAVVADPWLGMNRALDTSGGPTRVDVSLPSALAAASLAGSWSIDTVISSTKDPTTPVGTTSHRDWTFARSVCDRECTVALSRTYGGVGKPANSTLTETLKYADGKFRAYSETLGDCTNADGSVLASGYFLQINSYDLNVATVESRNGLPTATRLEGTSLSSVRFAGAPFVSGCYLNSIDPTIQTVEGNLVTPAVSELAISVPVPQPVQKQLAMDADSGKGGLGSSPSSETRSVLSSLTSFNALDLSIVKVLGTVGVALILLLVVGYPAQLLSSTISTNYDRIFGWLTPVKKRLVSLRGSEQPSKTPRSRRVGVAVGIVASSVIAGFVDPGFGVNLASLRVLASLALAFLVGSLCDWLVASAVARRLDSRARPHVRFRYGSLLIVLGAVLFSRITGFEPGMVFGTIVGLTLGITLAQAASAKLALAGLGYSITVSVVAWLIFSVMTPTFGAHPDFVQVFVQESLSGFAIGGFVSLPLTLLPLTVFTGGSIFVWRKSVWAAVYVVGLSVFLLILLPLPSSWGSVQTPLAAWLGAYLAFGIFCLAVWAYFRIRPSAPKVVPAPSEEKAGTTAGR